MPDQHAPGTRHAGQAKSSRLKLLDAVESNRWEWPTLAVAAAIYATFTALTLGHAALPWWLLLVAGGYVTAWHGSLQHEVVHGHPTPSAAFNELLVLPSLWLWLPFRIYRESHRRHHAAIDAEEDS